MNISKQMGAGFHNIYVFNADKSVVNTGARPDLTRHGEWEREGDTVKIHWYWEKGRRGEGRVIMAAASDVYARYVEFENRIYETEEWTLEKLKAWGKISER